MLHFSTIVSDREFCPRGEQDRSFAQSEREKCIDGAGGLANGIREDFSEEIKTGSTLALVKGKKEWC